MKVDNEAQVVEAVQDARERRCTLEIVAGGTRRAFGRSTPCGEVLDVSRLGGIVSYEPEELILTVRPGTKLAEIEQVLAAKNQRLGFEPQDWSALLGSCGTATIGGAISSDANGSAAVRYGRARDHLLGIRAVNGLGEAYKAGGKVVKNVTGFDIPKLMCGAMGTLGVLTELTFRVFPKPLRVMTFLVRGLDGEQGLSLLRRVWSSPLEATGLRFEDDVAAIRLEGSEGVLDEKAALLRAIAGACDTTEEDVDCLASQVASERDIWRVVAPPAHAAQLLTEAAPPDWCADWAGGLLWIGMDDGDFHGIAERHGGSAVLVRASEATRSRVPSFPPEEPARAALTRAVKAAFDPLHLFNPGRMYEGV